MTKKVSECTIEELEKYYISKVGCTPYHIDIYWYDVRFIVFNVEINKDEIEFYLKKDEEIEVE